MSPVSSSARKFHGAPKVVSTATAKPPAKSPARKKSVPESAVPNRTEVRKAKGKTCVLLKPVLTFACQLPQGLRLKIGQRFADGVGTPRLELKWANGKVAVSGIAADMVAID